MKRSTDFKELSVFIDFYDVAMQCQHKTDICTEV